MTEWVAVTDHAAHQWRTRADRGDPPIGPRVAWMEATVVPEPHGLEADEVRYHQPSGVVLLRKDTALVTVIAVDHTAKPSLRAAVRRLGNVAELHTDGGGR